MNERKQPVIKNVTPQDFKSFTEEDSIEAKPLSSLNNQIDIIPEDIASLKPKKSPFEPDPIKFILPSGKLFVEEGYIYVRRLSTSEENMFLKLTSEKDFNEAVNRIFNTAIKSSIDIGSIPIIDKVGIFICIVSLTYGGKLSIYDFVKDDCKTCGDNENVSINALTDIETNILPDDFEYPMQFITDNKEFSVKFRYPTIKDEVAIESDGALDYIKRITIEIKNLSSNTILDKKSIEEIVEWLSTNEKKQISKKLGDFSSYGNKFTCTISSCSNKNCFMKNQKIELKAEDLLSRVVQYIAENLS
jgi:hypothetical protein